MLWEVEGALSGGFGFNTALFDAATVERWQEHFVSLLAAVAERPDLKLEEIPLLGEVERRQLLAWSAADGVEVLSPSGQPAPSGVWGAPGAGARLRRPSTASRRRAPRPTCPPWRPATWRPRGRSSRTVPTCWAAGRWAAWWPTKWPASSARPATRWHCWHCSTAIPPRGIPWTARTK